MISIRFLVFFYDATEERPNRLAAVTPLFSSPAAVKMLMKTAKFEKRDALVVSGDKDQLEKLVSQVERLDVTDWLSVDDWETIKSKIVQVTSGIEGLSIFDYSQDEEIVFGDEEVLAKAYPPDLPEGQEKLWDDVKKKYKNLLKGDKDKRQASLRKLYKETAQRLGLVPFVYKHIGKDKKDLMSLLANGEKKAHTLLAKIGKHALSEGVVKRITGLKFGGSEACHQKQSGIRLCHTLTWTLGADKAWRDLVRYLTVKEAFHQIGPKLLTLKVNQKTEIEVYATSKDHKIAVSIVHSLSSNEVKTLIGTEVSNPIRELNRFGKLWHEKGEIPS